MADFYQVDKLVLDYGRTPQEAKNNPPKERVIRFLQVHLTSMYEDLLGIPADRDVCDGRWQSPWWGRCLTINKAILRRVLTPAVVRLWRESAKKYRLTDARVMLNQAIDSLYASDHFAKLTRRIAKRNEVIACFAEMIKFSNDASHFPFGNALFKMPEWDIPEGQ